MSPSTQGSCFPWWEGTRLGRMRESLGTSSQSCPTAFGVGEGSKMGKGLQKWPSEQGPRNLPGMVLSPALYPLILPVEDTDFPPRVQTSPLFPWISQAKLGASTRNLPRKPLATGNKTQARAHKDMRISYPKMTEANPGPGHAAFQ